MPSAETNSRKPMAEIQTIEVNNAKTVEIGLKTTEPVKIGLETPKPVKISLTPKISRL